MISATSPTVRVQSASQIWRASMQRALRCSLPWRDSRCCPAGQLLGSQRQLPGSCARPARPRLARSSTGGRLGMFLPRFRIVGSIPVPIYKTPTDQKPRPTRSCFNELAHALLSGGLRRPEVLIRTASSFAKGVIVTLSSFYGTAECCLTLLTLTSCACHSWPQIQAEGTQNITPMQPSPRHGLCHN